MTTSDAAPPPSVADSPGSPAAPEVISPLPWGRHWTRTFALIALVAGLLLGFRPDPDGDIWWHMAYGRQMLENRTLRLDHTIYSWTPSSNEAMYCAWITQILLYVVYQAAGVAGHYALRYLLLALVFYLAWRQAAELGVDRHPVFWMASLLALLMSLLAVTSRPQIVSYVLVMASAIAWRRLHRGTPGAWRFCYVFPVLMVVWTNSHPAFVIGLALFAAILVGEELNALYTPRLALPLAVRRHLIPAMALSLVAVAVNPYGPGYLVKVMTAQAATPAGHRPTVGEYLSVITASPVGMHLGDLGLLSLAILLVLAAASVGRDGLDWAAALPAGLLGALYVLFLRSTIFWPPLFLVLVATYLRRGAGRLTPASSGRANALASVVLVGALALLGRFAYDGVAHPVNRSWLGFGISYMSPVEEAEFIDHYLPGCRLGNDYDTGAYLLWRLWPRTKIFIDARFFPFAAWGEDLQKLISTDGIEGFLRRFPCDAWCISIGQAATLNWFARSPDWRPAFYGPSAAIFVRRGLALPVPLPQIASGVDCIQDLVQAIHVALFAASIGDWRTARRVVAGMESNWRFWVHRDVVRGTRASVEVLEAYARHDFATAVEHLDRLPEPAPVDLARVRAVSLLNLSLMHWERQEHAAALARAEAALAVVPQDNVLLYNAGVIGWYLSLRGESTGISWRSHLQRFLVQGQSAHMPEAALSVARAILSGSYSERPVLLTLEEDRR